MNDVRDKTEGTYLSPLKAVDGFHLCVLNIVTLWLVTLTFTYVLLVPIL